MTKTAVVVGLGEVGRPLHELIVRAGQPVIGLDVDTLQPPEAGTVSVMHVCYPFEIPDFVGETQRYAELLQPDAIVINSTVPVGTTRTVFNRVRLPISHSPIRGKHARMLAELTHYRKFIGPIDDDAGAHADAHFRSLGMDTRILSSPEASELAKLTETTYFGLLIAWAQEVERYCDLVGASYDEVVQFYEEIDYLPRVKFFPGIIGGHCVMPNIEILGEIAPASPVLQSLKWSNEQKIERDTGIPAGAHIDSG